MSIDMTIPLDSDLMRGFLAVADSGSVTRAADVLGRTQSAVSMQIRKLEESLGQALFIRESRGVALTQRGEQLLPYARRVTGLLEEAARALRVMPLTGPVRVGIPDEYIHSVLPAALQAFAACHPSTDVMLRCDFSIPQAKALADGLIDLAVVYEQPGQGEAELLAVDPTVWMTSIAHAQHLRTPLPIATYFESDWCRDVAVGSLDRLHLAYRIAFECDTSGGMRSAVQNGLAIAPLSRSTIPPGCRELGQDDGFEVIEQARIVLRQSPHGSSPAIEAMADTLREAFAPLALRAGR